MVKAVVLSSGGIDSTTAMAIVKSQGFQLFSLSFDYGQRHRCELRAARRVADHMKVEKHLVLKIDLTAIGGSALTQDIAVPKGREITAGGDDIPVTYVPARNTIFLSYGLAWAEVIWAPAMSLLVSTPWITAGTPIAGRRSFPPSRRWPTWRPGQRCGTACAYGSTRR
jgi:queuosine biosynthesis protein QueC